jgi:hypothetical protein
LVSLAVFSSLTSNIFLFLVDLKIPEQRPSRPPRLSHGEVANVKALISKYGDNYKAMSRDLKINVYQHTPKQIKKRVELYRLFYEGGQFGAGKQAQREHLKKKVELLTSGGEAIEDEDEKEEVSEEEEEEEEDEEEEEEEEDEESE